MEAREDAELGWDVHNDDTFGGHCEEWSFGQTFGLKKVRRARRVRRARSAGRMRTTRTARR